MSERTIIKRKPLTHPGWQKKLVDKLQEWGVIPAGYTGKLNFSFHQGGIADCEKVEKVK